MCAVAMYRAGHGCGSSIQGLRWLRWLYNSGQVQKLPDTASTCWYIMLQAAFQTSLYLLLPHHEQYEQTIAILYQRSATFPESRSHSGSKRKPRSTTQIFMKHDISLCNINLLHAVNYHCKAWVQKEAKIYRWDFYETWHKPMQH